MPIWKLSVCETFFEGPTQSEKTSCVVRIHGSEIVVDAGSAVGGWMYIGEELGAGHYNLKCTATDGVGTLHCFDDDNILEGWWYENKQRGMWRVTLLNYEDD